MRRLSAIWFLQFSTLCLLVLFSTQLHAAIPPISSDELALKTEPLAPGASAIILYRQVDRDDNGSTSHEDNFIRIKILTEEGRKYANVEIPFVKEQDEVANFKARTIRPDGSVVNFEGKPFEKSLVKARGVKYLAKAFTLSDVQAGSIIEYSYTYNFFVYVPSHWILSEDLFTRRAVFSLKPFHDINSRYHVRWMWQLLPAGTNPPKQGPDSVIRLEANNIPAFQTEELMPPANELKARVDFIYSDDPGDSQPETYWKNVGKRRYEEQERFIDKRGAMQQAVSQIVTPQDPPEIKLEKIYYRVQQMRNTSYEAAKTQQEEKREQTKKTLNVEDIWNRGYGNAFQLNLLFLALARAAQLDADGLWVSSRATYFFNPKTESDGSRLNANVVIAKANGKEFFCDPGSKFSSFGFLPWYETGVAGLRLDKEGGTWIKTPLPPPSDSTVQRKASFVLNDSGDLEGKLTIMYTGSEAARRRSEERNDDEAGRKKFLEEAVKLSIPAVSDPALINQPAWNTSSTPLVAEFSVKVSAWASQAGRRVLLPVGLFAAQEKHLFDHAQRIHPIYMDFSFQQTDDVTIVLPAGWQIGNLPPAHTQDGHVITYSLTLANDKGSVHLNRTMTIDFLILERQYYSALRTFMQGVKSSDDQQIVLQPGATAASK
jgi:hypothetical protein